jgi:hypothetical protein
VVHRLLGDSGSFSFEFAVYGTPDRLARLMDARQLAQAAELQREVVERMSPIERTHHAWSTDDFRPNNDAWLCFGHLLDLGEWGTLVRPWIPELFSRLEERVPM